MRNKVVSAAEAVAIIRSGDMIATSGFVGVGTPDEIFVALERRFLDTGKPRDLGFLFAAAPGDGDGPPPLATLGAVLTLTALAGFVLVGPWLVAMVGRGVARLSRTLPGLLAARLG